MKIYANFKVRLIAHIIDIAILYLSVIMLSTILAPLPEVHTSIFKELAYIIISIIYYTIFTSSNKCATIGKLVMKIKVVNEKMDRLSLAHSLARSFSYYFSYITLGLGFIMILFTKNNMALHDKISNTYVIYNKKAT